MFSFQDNEFTYIVNVRYIFTLNFHLWKKLKILPTIILSFLILGIKSI